MCMVSRRKVMDRWQWRYSLVLSGEVRFQVAQLVRRTDVCEHGTSHEFRTERAGQAGGNSAQSS